MNFVKFYQAIERSILRFSEFARYIDVQKNALFKLVPSVIKTLCDYGLEFCNPYIFVFVRVFFFATFGIDLPSEDHVAIPTFYQNTVRIIFERKIALNTTVSRKSWRKYSNKMTAHPYICDNRQSCRIFKNSF